MAAPGIIGFGLFKLFSCMYPSPLGFNGVFANGRNTGFIDGWKLYANFFESIPFLLLLS